MIFISSNRGGNIPGGGLGCLLFAIFGLVAGYFILKGLYVLLYWLSPVLLVLAAIINWRIFPQTAKNWIKTLETQPVTALISLGFAVLLFPFFSLYMLLKAAGMKQLERMGQFMDNQQGAGRDQGEFTEFEEIESTPKGGTKPPESIEYTELPEEMPPVKSQSPPPPQPQNPYDQMFDQKD